MSASIWAPGSELVVVDAESTNLSQVFTASAGQTVFTITEYSYTPNTGSIAVYRGGQKLVLGIDYTETSTNTVTLTGISPAAGETIEIVAIIGSASSFAGQAETALLTFQSAYLGAFASAPTTDLQGNPLTAGQLYWDTVTNVMYGWTGSAWESSFASGTPDHLDFPATLTAMQEARLQWNSTDGTLDLGLKGGNVTLQIGQEQLVRVLNNTGSAMTDLQVVRITGASGQRLTVALAQADAEATSETTFAIITEPVANNQQGFATVSGLVRNVDTSAWAEGAALYLSPTVAGGITSVKPTAPDHTVLLGWCVRSAVDGSVFVSITNGHELNELHDVYISAVQAGDILVWDAAQNRWENSAPAFLDSADIGTTVQAYDIDTAKTDVAQNFTSPQRSALLTDNDGSFDLAAKQNFKCTTAGAVTLTFANQADGLSGSIIFVNASNHTVSAHANTKLTASDLAKLSATGTYRIDYLSDGTNAYCSVIGSY